MPFINEIFTYWLIRSKVKRNFYRKHGYFAARGGNNEQKSKERKKEDSSAF